MDKAQIRTSESHPLEIAVIELPEGGAIGLTFCPGKHQTDATTGVWQRDLALDLDAIKTWGASAVLTLVEEHELSALNVSSLGEEVMARGMAWTHMPIADFTTPDQTFRSKWPAVSDALLAELDAGRRVLVHCKGGLGRTGLVSAMLLVDRGMPAEETMALVRKHRPGAIENRQQENYLQEYAREHRLP